MLFRWLKYTNDSMWYPIKRYSYAERSDGKSVAINEKVFKINTLNNVKSFVRSRIGENTNPIKSLVVY